MRTHALYITCTYCCNDLKLVKAVQLVIQLLTKGDDAGQLINHKRVHIVVVGGLQTIKQT